MTAPIRSMAGLVDGIRDAQLERELSDQVFEALAGVALGSVAKYIGPNPCKRLGPVTTFPLLGALGKALVIVDDPEQIKLVEGRWKKRKIVGGSARQLKLMARKIERASIGSNLEKLAELLTQMSAKERIIAGASKGGKRRAKRLGKRKTKRIASLAARARWAKAVSAL